MIFKIMVLFIPVLQTQAYWELKWNDEFDNDFIDSTKWEVSNEVVFCDGNYNQQLNCKTNSTRNLWSLDGTLAIAAVAEKDKYLDRDFTSALITTKKDFTYGKFEVRAALPKGKLLRVAMYLSPIKETAPWPKDGQISLLVYEQTQSLKNGIHSDLPYQDASIDHRVVVDLKQFHSYILEWNQSTILWKFDDMEYLNINLTDKLAKYYNPFNLPFKLVITLGVGGDFVTFKGVQFANKEETMDEKVWDCSLLILDYVRIYEWKEGNQEINKTDLVEVKKRNSSPEAICGTVMPLIRLQKETKLPLIEIVSILSLIFLLVLILLVTYVFYRLKKSRSDQISSGPEFYADTQPDIDLDNYEDVKYTDEYTDIYESEQKPNTNFYLNGVKTNQNKN